MKTKTEVKHTPGPKLPYLTKEGWADRVEKSSCGCYMKKDVVGGAAYFQCAMHSAAPDLLKAGESVLRLWDNGGNPAGAFQALREAISKAEGRE